MNKPSGWFTAVCITAIVLGSLGVLTGLFNLVSLATSGALQKRLSAPPPTFGQSADQVAEKMQVQREMQREMQKVADRWIWVTGPLLGVSLAISTCLIVGGAGSLRLRPGGRTLLLIACWAAIVLELARLGPTIVIQRENMAVMGRHMSRLIEVSVPQGQKMPDDARAMSTVMMKVAAVVAIAVAAILTLAKIGFYALSVIYLRRPNVRELFGPPIIAEVQT